MRNRELEITPTAKTLADLWSRELVDRDPLRARIGQFSARTMWDLESHCDLHLALAELSDRPLKFGHAVDQNWLIALEMPGEQQSWRMRIQPHHRYACPERLDCEDQLCAQPTAEMVHVGGYVTAGEVDEVEPIKHEREPTGVSGEERAEVNVSTPYLAGSGICPSRSPKVGDARRVGRHEIGFRAA
jgi:hypothetical protein